MPTTQKCGFFFTEKPFFQAHGFLFVVLVNKKESGHRAFLDREEIHAGDSIPSTIHNAICSSLVQVAIFSPGYAESKWYLDELVLMLQQTKALFIPVFYDVAPWCLRDIENGVYAAAFSEYESKGRYLDKLDEWKKALNSASDVSVYELSMHKHNLCKRIVSSVVKEIEKRKPLYVAKHPVRLTELIEDFEMHCQKIEENPKIVGIFGLGGSGKTTLATELFNRKRSKYNGSCFLYDVREASVKDELHSLQSKLLADLFRENGKCQNIHEGKTRLRNRLARSIRLRFLIVLDDIDHLQQLDTLLFEDVLSSDGLVIVTTRDKRVLTRARISIQYEMKGMRRHHASELFCWHAFLQSHSANGYEDLVKSFVEFCGGLPLSLKVLGAHVAGSSDRRYWQSELDKVKQMLPDDVKKRLKISFDALDNEEKQIFMDIACFFIGQHRHMAIQIWKGSGWHVEHALQTLRDKGLVEVVKNRHTNWQRDECVFRMHDHLRDLGREMADELGPPRLWRSQHLKFLESKGFAKILAEIKIRCFHSMRDSSIPSQITYFIGNSNDCAGTSTVLLWLELELEYPVQSIPSWIPMQNLQGLRVDGCLQSLWPLRRLKREEYLRAPVLLKDLELIYRAWFSKDLIESLGMLQHLENLILDEGDLSISNLEGKSFSESLTKLGNLRRLHMTSASLTGEVILSDRTEPACFESSTNSCMNILEYLHIFNTQHLSKLIISGETCPSLESLSLQFMENLIELDLKLVKTLSRLYLQSCEKLKTISGLSDLTELVTLKIHDCPEVKELPSLARLSCLESIHIYGCKKLQSIAGFEDLQGLKYLNLSAANGGAGVWNCISRLQRLPSEVTTIIGRAGDGAHSALSVDLFSQLIGVEAVTEILYRPMKRRDTFGDQEISVNMPPSLSAIIICALVMCSSDLVITVPVVGRNVIPEGYSIVTIVITGQKEIHQDDSVESIVKLSSGAEITRGFMLSVGLVEEWRTLPIFKIIIDRLYNSSSPGPWRGFREVPLIGSASSNIDDIYKARRKIAELRFIGVTKPIWFNLQLTPKQKFLFFFYCLLFIFIIILN